MTRTLDRYVTREFTRLFLLFAICAPLLFILGDLTDNLDTYMERQLGAQKIAMSYVYLFPQYVLYSLPIAALIATIFTVSNMTRHSELAAAKAGGISFWRVLAPLPILGVLLTFAGLGLTELVPKTIQARAELVGKKRAQRNVRGDFVYRAQDGMVYAIRRLDLEAARIMNLIIEREGDEPTYASLHVKANEATFDREIGRWTLNNGQLRLLRGEDERHFEFGKMIINDFRETPEELLAEPKDPDMMGYNELGRFIETLQRSGGNPLKLMVEQSQKLAIPVATLIIILFGAPLANSTQRGGTAYGIGISLGITITYLMLFKIFGAAGATGTVHPIVAAWLPNGLLLIAAGFLIAKVRT